MKITFSVFPPRAALRNEAESSDCKIEQIRNGLSTIVVSSCHVTSSYPLGTFYFAPLPLYSLSAGHYHYFISAVTLMATALT